MAGTTDMAALAAGVVAIAVSVIGEPGRYDSMVFVIGLSMLLIFAGYVMDNPRRPLQSVAVAAVVALSILPVFGFVFERATNGLMNNWWHGAVWLAAATLVFAFDRRLQPASKRSTTNRSEPD